VRDGLISFLTAYQSDPLHGPCEIRFLSRAIDASGQSPDKVLYWPTPQGPPGVLTIADAVDKFLGLK
jgi:hypothetical protein